MRFWSFSLASGLALSATSGGWAQEGIPSPEELFKSLDKNSDGVLQADEVANEQKRFFERLIRLGDKDENGELTRNEFLEASKEQAAPAPGPGGPGGEFRRPDPEELRRRFEMMDANKDGKVTLEEVPEPFRDRLRPVLERLGKDSVTLEEFARLSGGPGNAPGGRPPGGMEAGAFFERLDQDKNGKVSLSEIPEPLRPRMEPLFREVGKEELTREEFAQAAMRGGRPPGGRPDGDGPPMGRGPIFMSVVDRDRDGRVSAEEWKQAAEKFGELDRNGDGYLDLAELMGPPPGREMAGGPGRPNPEMGRPGSRPEGPNEGPNPFFARMDANKDGKISREEAPERMKERFDQMDRDGDGSISEAELRQVFGAREGRPNQRPAAEPGTPPSRPKAEGE